MISIIRIPKFQKFSSGASRPKLIRQEIFDKIVIELLIFLVSYFVRFRNDSKKTEEEFGNLDKELF